MQDSSGIINLQQTNQNSTSAAMPGAEITNRWRPTKQWSMPQ